MSIDRLLLGDDGSPEADVAWLWCNHQSWPGWELTVLTATPPPLGRVVAPEIGEVHDVDPPESRAPCPGAGFASVHFVRTVADPRLALTVGIDASLTVVGTAADGIGPNRLGSTTEWLVHDIVRPVVIPRWGRPVRRVLVCADGSPHATAAAASFHALPWAASCEVTILAVADGRTDPDSAVGSVEAVLGVRPGIEVIRRDHAKAHRAILAEAQESRPDLIVLGSSGLTVMRRLFLGSTANAVVRNVRTSVLISRQR